MSSFLGQATVFSYLGWNYNEKKSRWKSILHNPQNTLRNLPAAAPFWALWLQAGRLWGLECMFSTWASKRIILKSNWVLANIRSLPAPWGILPLLPEALLQRMREVPVFIFFSFTLLNHLFSFSLILFLPNKCFRLFSARILIPPTEQRG